VDEQLRLLLEIAARLDSASIPYMVTGSMALAAYATPRMTRDIDLVVQLDEAYLTRWASVLGVADSLQRLKS